MQTNAAVDAGGKIDPVPVGTLGVLAGAGVNAGNGTSIHAVGYAFASVGDDRMGHGSFSRVSFFATGEAGTGKVEDSFNLQPNSSQPYIL